MISVITPTYNRVELLEQTIQSFINQDYPQKEMIIINDGSDEPDKYLDLMLKYKDHPICYYYFDHRGCPAALNKGIKIAHGRYISVLADDDLLEAHSLSMRVMELKEKGYDLIYTGYYNLYDQKKEEVHVLKLDMAEIFKYDYINIQSMMWKREVHEKIGYFSEDLKYSEDWEWKIRCLMELNWGVLDYPTVCSRRHPESKSNNREESKIYIDMLLNRMKEKYGVEI